MKYLLRIYSYATFYILLIHNIGIACSESTLSPMSKKMSFYEKLSVLEKELFPEFNGKGSMGNTKNPYMYFSPSYYFSQDFFTEKDLNSFLKDKSKTILSVGSGPAYLEQILVKLGISSKNIVLSDIDYSSLPPNFQKFQFDMFRDWPKFKNKFDLIFLPESIFFIKYTYSAQTQSEENQIKIKMLKLVVDKALQNLKNNGKIRISLRSQDSLASELEKTLNIDMPQLNFRYNRFFVELFYLTDNRKNLSRHSA